MDISIVDQDVEFLNDRKYWDSAREMICAATRTAYRSENCGTTDEEKVERDGKLVLRLLHPEDTVHPQHTSTFEHAVFSVRIKTSRAIANELVRHRHTAYTQESTRYVNFGKKSVEFIRPYGIDTDFKIDAIRKIYSTAYESYLQLIKNGVPPQVARDVLPLGLATTLVMTTNIAQWRSFFNLRCDSGAHPHARELANRILTHFHKMWSEPFDDLVKKFNLT